MSELISGKEAFDAAYNGVEVQWRWAGRETNWRELKGETAFSINELNGNELEFRLKPRTITINDSDVPCCCSIGINRVKGKIEIDFKSTDDADVAYKVLKGAFGF